MRQKITKIAIVALNALPVIDPLTPGPIGGIETRSWMLARGLAKQPETEVSFVVRHGRSLRIRSVEGVKLHLLRDRLYQRRESLALRLSRIPRFPGFSLKSPKCSDLLFLPLVGLQRLWRGKTNPLKPSPGYEKLTADVFLTFGVQGNSAKVIASAHAAGRPAVLFVAHDDDLDERYLTQPDFVNQYHDSAAVCRWIIENADLIIVQTEAQLRKLETFGRTGALMQNPIDFDQWDEGLASTLSQHQTADFNRYALWIGRAENVLKQPLVLIDLAQRCPEMSFLMILNRRDDAVEAEVRRTAPANVKILERVPFEKMPGIMRSAAVLVNTSSREGFPNTFLQAAASGVPIASLNVEAKFLQESRAGFCASGDLAALEKFVRNCWAKTNTGIDLVAARSYIESRHALTIQAAMLSEILNSL